MGKAKVVKSILDDKRVKKTLSKAKLGGAAALAEQAVDVVDNPYLNAAQGAAVGFAAGGLPGAIVGGSVGYLIGDQIITFPMPMIAIPAHESHLLSRVPSMQVYIRAGETLMPTGGNVRDFEQGVAEATALEAVSVAPVRTKKKTTAYQRKYKKAFAKVKRNHMKKDGTWKKGGFKAAVKAAHRMCK